MLCISGISRSPACKECNLNLTLITKIPVVFHDLQNYDSHLILQELGKYNFKTSVIPKTIEKYLSITTEHSKSNGINSGLSLVLIDSVHFLNNSLVKIVRNIAENNYHHVSQEFADNILHFVKKKEFFPYDYRDSFENLKKFYIAKINFIIHWLIVQ